MARSSKKAKHTAEEVRDIITAMPWEEQERLAKLLAVGTGNAIGRKMTAILNHHFIMTEALEREVQSHLHTQADKAEDERIIELKKTKSYSQLGLHLSSKTGRRVSADAARQLFLRAKKRQAARSNPRATVTHLDS